MKSGSSLLARKPFPTRSLLVWENAASTESLQARTIKDSRLDDQLSAVDSAAGRGGPLRRRFRGAAPCRLFVRRSSQLALPAALPSESCLRNTYIQNIESGRQSIGAAELHVIARACGATGADLPASAVRAADR